MGANHNVRLDVGNTRRVVSNVPKILKWEQITTEPVTVTVGEKLFPMFQRY